MSLQIATVKERDRDREREREREREDETRPVTVTDVQAISAYYPEAAAAACLCM